MRCRVGDLAILVQDKSGYHEGAIVECVRLYEGPLQDSPNVPCWVTTPILVDPDGIICRPCDDDLRPLRPDEGEDEMLRIAGLPHKEIA
jgi:hypothetical protein